MSDIWDLASQLGAKIIFFKPNKEITKDGMYYRELDTVCLNDTVSSKRQENVLLHEIGHSFHGHKHYKCHSIGWSFRQERQADEYMIQYRADQWLSEYDWEPEFIDYKAFMDYFEIDNHLYDLVVEVFSKILSHSQLGSYSI